jgi:hypothetical protein
LQTADPFAYAVFTFDFSQSVSDCACKLQIYLFMLFLPFAFPQYVSDCFCSLLNLFLKFILSVYDPFLACTSS